MAEQTQKKSLSVPDTQRHSLLLNKYLGHFCCQNHHKDTCLQQSCDPWCPQTCSPQKAAQSLARAPAELGHGALGRSGSAGNGVLWIGFYV